MNKVDVVQFVMDIAMLPESRPAPIIVTLIHGTFDNKARWTEPGSKISETLLQVMGDNLHVTKFQWSGKNSQSDRDVAANQLVDHIAANSIFFPSSPQFLVGHSHGGNLIRWALGRTSPAVSDKVRAAVTISTPFIEVVERNSFADIHLLFVIWRNISIFFISLTWLSIFATYSGPIMNFFLLRDFFAVTQVPGVMLAAAVPMFAIYKSIKNTQKYYENKFISSLMNRQNMLLKINSLPISLCHPFLCIYTKADEVNLIFHGANAVVALWRVVGELFEMLSLVYSIWLVKVVEPFIPFLVLVVGMGAVIIVVGNLAGHETSKGIIIEYVADLTVLGIALVVGVPIAICVGIFLYGTSKALDLFVIDICTSMHPSGIGNVKVSVVSSIAARIHSANPKAHTAILYSEQVASEIAKFIKENLADASR